MSTNPNRSKKSSNSCTSHGPPSRKDVKNHLALVPWRCCDSSDRNISTWRCETHPFESNLISRALNTLESITALSVAVISPDLQGFFWRKSKPNTHTIQATGCTTTMILSIHCRLHHITKTNAHTLTECGNIQTLGQYSSSEKTNHLQSEYTAVRPEQVATVKCFQQR